MMHASRFLPDHADALDASERFLLWTVRAWVRCCKARTLPSTEVEDAFAEIGLPDAAEALDAALRGVAHATLRPLLVHCPHCPGVSEDERCLIAAAAAMQHQCRDRAHDLLSDIVHPFGADPILAPLGRLGLMLALAGIAFPEPDGRAAAARSGTLPRSAATIH